jgi:threonine/homoserine/homoserine lactone efflux protein
MVVMAAGSIALTLTQKPGWATVQRWVMGTVLFGFAVRMVVEGRR